MALFAIFLSFCIFMQNRGKFISFFYLSSIPADYMSLVFCYGEDAVSLLDLYSHIAYTRQNLAFHVVAHAYL